MPRVFLAFVLAILFAAGAVAQEKAEHLTFTDHKGRTVSERDYLGSYQLIFFGYTHCPDVCPMDLQILSQTMAALGPQGKRVRPIFITFDPERDTAPVMTSYVSNFHPRLIGLTGTKAQISAAARAYEVVAEKSSESDDAKEYLINHTALTYLIGPKGEGLEIFDHGTGPEAMVARIRAHLDKDK